MEDWLAQLFLAPEREPQAVARLAEWGFLHPQRADRWLQELAGGPEVREVFLRLAPSLLEHLRESPAPEMALGNLVRFVEVWGERRGLYEFWEEAPWALERSVRLMALSQVFADILVRHPELMDLLADTEQLARRRSLAEMLAEARRSLTAFRSLERQWNALRRFKRREFLRIGARDWLGLANLPEALQELSDLAEACSQAALEVCWAALEEEWGHPLRSDGRSAEFAIIGMGKFGARELNYNSDIDVMFVYDGEGETRGGPRPPLSNRLFFERLARLWLEAMGRMTEEGRVFRVDARLRPEGETGPLVRSLDGYINYYEAWAEPWEMQALIKARAVAGSESLRQRFEALAQEVAFRRHLDADALYSLRRMKQQLEEREVAQGLAERQVKQGYGGIRDIEFTVQLLQLVYGVENPRLRVASTLGALEALAQEGILSEEEREVLEQSYLFLRRVEHLLQIQGEVPQQTLPEAPEELERLARRMGYQPREGETAAERFLKAYAWHTGRARRLCEQLFFHPIPEGEVPLPESLRRVLDPLLPHGEAATFLQEYGFRQPAEVRRRLIFLAYGEPPMRLPERVQRAFARLLPLLLERARETADPDLAIRHFERFVTALGGREMLYDFLLEQPDIAELLLLIGGASEALSETLIRHPEYLDFITDAAVMAAPKGLETFLEEMGERLGSLRTLEEKGEDLRRYRRREMFRIGVRDLEGRASVTETLQELSDLADASLRSALALLREEHGGGLPFAVMALGKWGGREIHYSSDLDVLFVYEARGEHPSEAEARSALELAEALLRVCNTPMREGKLFELDARLRPDGREGPLVRTLPGYLDYYRRRGEIWERMALTRLRWVAGDEELGRRFVEQVQEWVYHRPLSREEVEQLLQIHRRVEREKGPAPEVLDVKLSPGGLFDVEFLTQMLLLQHGPGRPEVRSTNTFQALRRLHEAEVLSSEEAEVLLKGYLALRGLELKLQLVTERSFAQLHTQEEWQRAARRLGHPDAAAFRQTHLNFMARIRKILEARFRAALEGL